VTPDPLRTFQNAVLAKSVADRFAVHVFPSGARVLVDGRDEAIVRQAFPKGSSSFMFPHYKVDFVGGDKNVAVNMKRVGVDRK
jgi:hypothetical protein